MDVEDKVVLVTGAGSGIGAAIAIAMAKAGARLVSADIDHAAAKQTADAAAKLGAQVLALQADVGAVDQIDAMIEATVAHFGRLDVIVNNAGVTRRAYIMDLTEADWDRIHRVNAKGVFFCLQYAARKMIEQGGGCIINISSVCGVMALGTYSAYCAAKAGVNFMTRALSQELAPHGIAVNAILPGNTATPMNEDIRTEPEFKTLLDGMAAATPSGRTYSEAIDMARAALFLASGEGRAMHGALMVMDEGFSLGM